MNPELYNYDYVNPTTGITAKKKWSSDTNKKKFAEKQGYSVLQIWERDWRNNQSVTLQKIKDFLNDD